jgi:hypothetical protein
MEQIKLKSRESIVYNVIYYLILSLGFLYLEYSYRHHLSPLSFVLIKKSIHLFWFQILIVVTTAFTLWKFHKKGLGWYIASTMAVTFKISEGLFIDFNKLIVIGLFFYLVIAFFLYQMLCDYYDKSYMNPNYSRNDLFDPLLLGIKVKISDDLGKEYEGVLTNWDDYGCFVKLDTDNQIEEKLILSVYFKNRTFEQSGVVVCRARDNFGIGVKFNGSKKSVSVFNWAEFIEIVEELGYLPERLR